MDVFDLADNLRAEFQEKGVSDEEFLLKIAERSCIYWNWL